MRLKEMLSKVSGIEAHGEADFDIEGIFCDSRRPIKNGLFVALPGARADGVQFISGAVSGGAVAVVTENKGVDTAGALRLVAQDARAALADLAAVFYGYPASKMRMSAVTGTNGKTTTTFLIKSICDHEMLRCGLIGTVRYVIGDEVVPATRTTPESLEVQALLARMRAAGCKAATMEVSSHAVVQSRVRGIDWDAAVFTNLTQDHLDYHGTMEAYFAAKAQLFDDLAAQSRKKGRAIVNLDDRYGARLIERISRNVEVVTFGMGARAAFRASNVQIDFNGTSFRLDAQEKSFLVRLPLIGRFNVYNALGAIAAASALGIPVRNAVSALENAPAVPGRLEPVPAKRQFRIFVDYAHTDDALTNVMKTLRELSPRRLIVVFGCGGDRDKAKRPLMAAAVERDADLAIITSDNPRREDPMAIIDDIRAGFRGTNYEVIADRHAAIERAVSLAQPRDIVLIAGKGHETYQEFADRTVPFDDVAVARAALEMHPVEMKS
jgi:UDP-N-acetylmuramoyl-L-alanyl-D-glutamate--2,6-diaminopimelate ligase